MPHFLLFYEGVDNYAEVRAPFRPAHLEHARAAYERGDLVQAGGYANPLDGSLFVFRGDAPTVATQFAESDPYVRGGVVKRWSVREWTTVVGADATIPTFGT